MTLLRHGGEEGLGRIVCHRAYRGPRPINRAYLSAVE
jgi:hypothetical protein